MLKGQIQYIETNNLTEMTLRKLIQIANLQKSEPLIRQAVERIVCRVPEKDWFSEIREIFQFVKDKVRYTRDVDGLEYVRTPYRIMSEIQSHGYSFGDCDCMSLFLATLLKSAGYKTRYVIIRTAGNPIDAYNHIYVEAHEPKMNKWICLDATEKSRVFGWCPKYIKRKNYPV